MNDGDVAPMVALDSAVHLWRCTHPLCTRVVQDTDIDHLRFMAQHSGDVGYENEAMRILIDKRDTDRPPKCIGQHLAGGNYRSHRAEVMELVEFVEADRA